MKINFFIKLFHLLMLVFPLKLSSDTYGNDYSTIQGQLSIPGNTDNRIANDAYIDNGFNFADNTTSCSFDSFQPVLGVVNLNRGKLYLLRNLFFHNFFSFGSGGKVFGQGHVISFPYELSTQLPDTKVTKTLGTGAVSTQTMVSTVNSVSWAYNNQYLAGGSNAGANNLCVYPFSNNTLSSAANPITTGSDINSLAWSPNAYYLAVGIQSGTNSLTIYQWNPLTQQLTTQAADRKNLSTGVSSVAWSHNGNYLAVTYGTGLTAALQIYSYSGAGTLSTVGSAVGYGILGDTQVPNALSWNSADSILTVATNGLAASTIFLYSFNGGTPTQIASLVLGLGNNIDSVSYKPGNPNTIAVGFGTSTTRLRLYEPTASTLTQRWANTESTDYNSANWSSDGNYLAAGLNTGGTNVRIYYFPNNNSSLSSTTAAFKLARLMELTVGSNVAFITFSNDNNYLAAGYGTTVGVFKINQMSETRKTLYMDNTLLNLTSDMELMSTITFYGNCSINGNGNSLTLNNGNGHISVASGGSLNLKNIKILGLKNQNLQCLSNDASISLENCHLTLTSDFIFDKGSLTFNQDVLVSGTNKFSYASTTTSYISAYSTVYFDANTTFSYSPRLTARHTLSEKNLIKMQDLTSSIFFDECNLYLPDSGWQVTKGTIFLNNKINIYSSSQVNSFELGDGTIANEPSIQLLSGANIENYGNIYINFSNS